MNASNWGSRMGALAGFAALLVAAAPPALAAAAKPEVRPPEGANLFIYRHQAYPKLLGVFVWVDLRKVATLRHNRWTALRVAPGPHIIQLRWPKGFGQSDYGQVVTIGEGKTAYFGIAGFPGTGSSLVIGDAADMQACCRYTKAK